MWKGTFHEFDEEITQKSRVRGARWYLGIGRIERNLDRVCLHKSNESSQEKGLILEALRKLVTADKVRVTCFMFCIGKDDKYVLQKANIMLLKEIIG